ncbi:MAG: Lrp/AsnC family transcriptional regulator [Spartobacteria bacterium]|nr:Lrp/AsnC family transcriptional regulator [Spartobacteria bacterium]
MDEILSILSKNALETPENMARMLETSADEVRERIKEYEEEGVIRGYHAIVNEDKLDLDRVTAVIEVKVIPERDGGFDNVAQRISRFPEVRSLYLMSGAFDLLLFIDGSDLRDVASFVSAKLSTIEGVTATATHFMLKTYKDHGFLMEKGEEYERLKVSP